MNTSFEFQFPWILAFLAFLPLYAFLRGRVGKLSALLFSSADVARAAGATARAAAGRLFIFLRLLTVGLLIVTLAGPRFANDRTETETSGIDIMLVLDLSFSMIALDMAKPGERTTRYDIAASVLKEFIRKRPNDRIGLIAFSGVPYLCSPLTLNHDWLIENLNRLHVGTIQNRSEVGTAIGDATVSATKRLRDQQERKSRVIILLTDGDNNKGVVDPVPAAQLAAAMGVKVYTIGIGINQPCQLPYFDANTGELLPNPDCTIRWGMTIQPANYEVLARMSALSRARSYRATNRRQLQSIYDDIDRLEKTEIKLRRYTTYTPLFQWPLLAALGLLALELILANTRHRRVP
jgi:Ca-activated chloride channel family protein